MKAFIFDFDGVIVDSEIHWDEHSFDTYREVVPAFTREYNRQLKGRNVHDIYEMIARDYGVAFSKEEFIAHIETLTDKIYKEWSKLLPGLTELTERLAAMGVPMAIASSGERRWIEPTLARLGMEGVFSPIVTAFDVGAGKPDPAVFAEAARLMGCDPADCVALEDSTNGVLSAKAAGMTCIALRHEGYAQDLSKADLLVESLDELTEDALRKL